MAKKTIDEDVIERFKRLPRNQQMAIARMTLSENIPELKEYFELKEILDENIKSLMTILANIKKFSDDSESEVIANYKRLLDKINALETELKSCELEETKP